MTDKKIFVYYANGDVDTIPVDSVMHNWCVEEGLFTVETRNGEPIFIGNMDGISCIKIEDCENFPENKKGVVDSDLRISANIMREEYRNNPEFRRSVHASISSAIRECSPGDDAIKAAADRLFGYETDSNN